MYLHIEIFPFKIISSEILKYKLDDPWSIWVLISTEVQNVINDHI